MNPKMICYFQEGGQSAMVDAKDLRLGYIDKIDIHLSNDDYIRVRCA